MIGLQIVLQPFFFACYRCAANVSALARYLKSGERNKRL